ncbi:MAG TPA: serine/threonine-protein kinase [Polyangiaceae bacterium]|nr:serine/threonine-protein kinase [Polyangiaceae bacterium]
MEDAPQFQMPFRPGEILAGKYEVQALLGVGGIGFVVAAKHLDLGEKVALKFLRPDALSNAEAVGRFAREARASVQIKSEHVARVFDVGHLPDGSPFIVMEYLEGNDLGALIDERGPLPIKLAVEYVLQACQALAAAHARGVVHRDVKPENLFLERRAQGLDVIKVLDFGISKVALTGSSFETRHPLAQTTMAMGSPTYMSPEQIRASQDIDSRTDIWSLGCVLYELLTGKPAFDAPSLTQISAAILEREPPSLRQRCPGASTGLEVVVKQCLAKDPRGRFQNVGELAVALSPYGTPRSQVAVEDCCSVLRGAGLSQQDFRLPSAAASEDYDLVSHPFGGLEVVESTPTVERSITILTRPAPKTRRVFFALGAAGLAGLAYAVLAVRSAEPSRGEPLAASQGAALPAPAAAPAVALEPVVPSAPLPAPHALPENPARAAEPAPAEPTPAREPMEAEAPSEAPEPADAPVPAHAAKAPAPAPPRRRAPPPAPPPKPKPPAPARPVPAVTGEPDIGF